ncbi:Histidine transport system permease protein hisM [Raoultella planticola]|uniref:Histidine transport system permease protein hisM n=1 Tax=Raoultella planticola TaxID=575 RepID=A0A485C6Y4_RAOPL|nr:Histidine transport system permease protein hisM [Raoultella planticola]
MIEIIQEYWKSLLWTDGYRFTGVAITLWLLISSVVMGGILAVFSCYRARLKHNTFSFRSGCLPMCSAVRRCMCSCWCFTPGCIRWKSSKAPSC